MNRRTFIRTTAATALVVSQTGTLLALPANSDYLKNIGIQLYSLRDALGKDAPGTLKQVAAAGYQQVELFGFPDADAMVAAAKDAGLAIHSTHFQWDCVANPKDAAFSDFSKILEKAVSLGLKHLVIPYLAESDRKSLDDYKKFAGNCNKASALAKKAGIQLAYHNHNFEFEPVEGGKSGYDILMAEFSEEMKFEIDIFWVKAAGLDPVALISKLKNRVSLLHLKDLNANVVIPNFGSLPNDAFQEIGDGVIAMKPILSAAKLAGVEHCHVEQDHSPDALASIRQSAEFLKKL